MKQSIKTHYESLIDGKSTYYPKLEAKNLKPKTTLGDWGLSMDFDVLED